MQQGKEASQLTVHPQQSQGTIRQAGMMSTCSLLTSGARLGAATVHCPSRVWRLEKLVVVGWKGEQRVGGCLGRRRRLLPPGLPTVVSSVRWLDWRGVSKLLQSTARQRGTAGGGKLARAPWGNAVSRLWSPEEGLERLAGLDTGLGGRDVWRIDHGLLVLFVLTMAWLEGKQD